MLEIALGNLLYFIFCTPSPYLVLSNTTSTSLEVEHLRSSATMFPHDGLL